MKIPVVIFATRCADSGEIEVWGGANRNTHKVKALRWKMEKAGFQVGALFGTVVDIPPAPTPTDVQIELPFHELQAREDEADRKAA